MEYLNTQYLLNKRPKGMPDDDCWKIHQEKIAKEERALRKREAEVRKMEKRERELIERLKRTQELQREAYEQLEAALAQQED